jgi:hypothetical protein
MNMTLTTAERRSAVLKALAFLAETNQVSNFNKMLNFERDFLSSFGWTPPTYTKTLLEAEGKHDRSTADEYCACIKQYIDGGYVGRGGYEAFKGQLSQIGRLGVQ